MNTPSPCLNCGACCAAFRVSFYWAETDATEAGLVPVHLTEQISPHLSCMQGTNQPAPRCTALMGSVGEGVRCNIYEQRSSSCRDFSWHGENGLANPDCQRARARHGLPPLPNETLVPAVAAAPAPAAVQELIPIIAA